MPAVICCMLFIGASTALVSGYTTNNQVSSASSVKCFGTVSTGNVWNYVDTGASIANRSSVVFGVRAASEALVALTIAANQFSLNMYEIVIGNATRGSTVIRKKKAGIILAEFPNNGSLNVISASFYSWFWIQWTAGNPQYLSVGQGCQVGQSTMLNFSNSGTLALKYMYIASGVYVSYANWSIPADLFSTTYTPAMTASAEVPCTNSRLYCSSGIETTTSSAVMTDISTTRQEMTPSPPSLTTSSSLMTSSALASTTPMTTMTTGFSTAETEYMSTMTPASTQASASVVDYVTTAVSPTSGGHQQTTPGDSLTSTAKPLEVTSSSSTQKDSATTQNGIMTSSSPVDNYSLSTRDVVGLSTAAALSSCSDEVTSSVSTAAAAATTTITTAAAAAAAVVTSNITASTGCPSPIPVIGATVRIISDSTGMAAIYQCQTGRQFPAGGTTRTVICIGDGIWSVSIPNCAEIQCKTLESVPSSYVTPVDTTVTSFSASFVRDVGETLATGCDVTSGQRYDDGSTRRTLKCASERGRLGVWSAPIYRCRADNCQPPTLVENATIQFDPSSRSVQMHCIVGHRFPTGLQTMSAVCADVDGSWDRPSHCGVLFCPALTGFVPPLTLSTEDVQFGVVVVVKCGDGFAFPDGNISITVRCLDPGVWNATVQRCQPVYCTVPALPANATLTVDRDPPGVNSSVPYGTMLSYSCVVDGQKFEDGRTTAVIRCAGLNRWNASCNSCDAGRCDPVPQQLNAIPSSTGRALAGTIVQYSCKSGFTASSLNLSLSAVCNGVDWIVTPVTCTAVKCPTSILDHANVTSVSGDNWASYGGAILANCDSGYRLTTDDVIEDTPIDQFQPISVNCTESGQWSPNFTCQPVDCGQPPSLSNAGASFVVDTTQFPGNVTANLTSFGSRVMYQCRLGYWFRRQVNTLVAICDADGYWRTDDTKRPVAELICIEVTCLPLLTHDVNTTDVRVEVRVTASCNGQRKAVLQTTCTIAGQWDPSVPDCAPGSLSSLSKRDLKEADGAQVVGTAVIVTMAITGCLIIVGDAPKLIATLKGV